MTDLATDLVKDSVPDVTPSDCQLVYTTLAGGNGRLDTEKRERIFIASDETPVLRRSWWSEDYMLIVSHDRDAVDLSRVGENGSCMFIEDHDTYSSRYRIGKIIDAQIKNKALEVTARINTLAAGQAFLQECLDNCEPGKSIQFNPYETELIKEAKYEKGKLVELPVYKLVKWGLLEISTVTIPAIGGVGFSHERKVLDPRQTLSLFGKHLSKRKLSDLLV